jgi:hypothetical protein
MTQPPPQRENVWLNLGFNVLVPALILMKGKAWLEGIWPGSEEALPLFVFVVALAFPLTYGAWDFVKRRKWNFFSFVGFVGVLLTGGIGLLRLPPEWVAIKEAAVPGVIGLAVLISHFTRRPLIRLFLFREEFFDIATIDRRLDERGERPAFERLVRLSNGLFAFSFLVSSILNFVLATWIVKSPPGTDAFNEELGRMTLLSYPVIVVPTMVVTIGALWMLFHGLGKLTGLSLEEMTLHDQRDPKSSERASERG